jgi:hypothetical protein
MRTDFLAQKFDEMIPIMDACLAIESFVETYLSRGDSELSDLMAFCIRADPDGLAEKSNSPAEILATLATVRRPRA